MTLHLSPFILLSAFS